MEGRQSSFSETSDKTPMPGLLQGFTHFPGCKAQSEPSCCLQQLSSKPKSIAKLLKRQYVVKDGVVSHARKKNWQDYTEQDHMVTPAVTILIWQPYGEMKININPRISWGTAFFRNVSMDWPFTPSDPIHIYFMQDLSEGRWDQQWLV